MYWKTSRALAVCLLLILLTQSQLLILPRPNTDAIDLGIDELQQSGNLAQRDSFDGYNSHDGFGIVDGDGNYQHKMDSYDGQDQENEDDQLPRSSSDQDGGEETLNFEDDQSEEEEQDESEDEEQQDSNKKDQQDYISKYGPQFKAGREQQSYKRAIYQSNNKKILEHNKDQSSTYQRGFTNLMYQDPNQFISIFYSIIDSVLMSLPDRPPQSRGAPMKAPPIGFKLQPIDWRKHMTEPGHQKSKCGSCYAFSVTSLLQAYYSIQNRQIKNFSEQQLVDCCEVGCYGCRGGWPSSALDYLAEQGLQSGQKYPYKAKKQKCKISQDEEYLKVLDYSQPYNQIQGLGRLEYALSQGPVTVIIDASTWDPLYRSGVFDQCPDGRFNYNHAVVLSGMRNDKAWILRNSWGSGWGDKGYIYLPKGNSCGVADRGVVPRLSSGSSDDQQQVDEQVMETEQEESSGDQQAEEEQQQEQGESEQDTSQSKNPNSNRNNNSNNNSNRNRGTGKSPLGILDPFNIVGWLTNRK